MIITATAEPANRKPNPCTEKNAETPAMNRAEATSRYLK